MASQLDQLVAMPLSVLAQIPAAPPPPGVTPNYTNPETLVPIILGVNSTFFAIASLFLILRVYMKAYAQRSWKSEDTLLILAWIIAVLYFSAGVLSCVRGAMGKNAWDLHMDSIFHVGWYYVFWITDAFSVAPQGLAKIAILLQYLHLFRTKRWMKMAIIGGIVVFALFHFAITLVFIIFTSPWGGETQIDSVSSWHVGQFAKWTPPIAVVGAIFDWYVLLLPIPAVLKLQLSPSKKLGVLSLFLTGGLACIASTLSVYYRYHINLSFAYGIEIGYILLWAQVEMWAGIIVACAPTVHMFWNRQSKLVRLSDMFKSSISRLAGRSSHSSGSAHDERVQNDDQRRIVKESPSMESARASTLRGGQHPLEQNYTDDFEMMRKKSLRDDQIMVEHSYSVSAANHRASDDSDTDVEAQRTGLEKKWPL